MSGSPTQALLWEIWRRRRMTALAIAGLTVAGRLVEPSSSLAELLRIAAFVFLFGVFTYAESSDDRGIGRFPRRLFTLPVSSLRLAAVPMVAGVAGVELLYAAWLDPFALSGAPSVWFVAVLLAALMVFYQTTVWTLERLGPLRLVVAGAVTVLMAALSLLPSFAPSPPPPWRSEPTIAAMVTVLALVAFLVAWRHMSRLRSGGSAGRRPLAPAMTIPATAVVPSRPRKPFASPAAAQFWFEWRGSGAVLPAVVSGVLLVWFAPISWLVRHDADDTLRLLAGVLAMPVVLAVPVGMAFARPTFWSEDLSLPAFVAVRPLADEQIVATRLQVAVASVIASWLLVLAFLGVWLSAWANLEAVRRVSAPTWASIVVAAIVLTWRFLAVRLWTGLSGSRVFFTMSVMSVVIAVIAGMAVDITRLPAWILESPTHVAAVTAILAIAAIAKYMLAAIAWRAVPRRYVRQGLLVWGAATGCLVWLIVLLPLPRAVMTLVALLTVPLARVGFAPASLARNRHR